MKVFYFSRLQSIKKSPPEFPGALNMYSHPGRLKFDRSNRSAA